MAAPLKFIFLLGLVVDTSIWGLERVDAAGQCGKTSPEEEAMKLVPCAEAAEDENAAVHRRCNIANRPVGHKCGRKTVDSCCGKCQFSLAYWLLSIA
ncbi:hypothetical protein SLEP1_g21489 [Rubroshorea leprosula]|uniref:Uncharacterized protein n=1 Tax=Rubroshorea leprosula TaxID=152421 RepID=A0AAV5JDI6_9ROSI|nr:hypothetical protein SLEP1_g21489 [Rubroshorea leprosula]